VWEKRASLDEYSKFAAFECLPRRIYRSAKYYLLEEDKDVLMNEAKTSLDYHNSSPKDRGWW